MAKTNKYLSFIIFRIQLVEHILEADLHVPAIAVGAGVLPGLLAGSNPCGEYGDSVIVGVLVIEKLDHNFLRWDLLGMPRRVRYFATVLRATM